MDRETPANWELLHLLSLGNHINVALSTARPAPVTLPKTATSLPLHYRLSLPSLVVFTAFVLIIVPLLGDRCLSCPESVLS